MEQVQQSLQEWWTHISTATPEALEAFSESMKLEIAQFLESHNETYAFVNAQLKKVQDQVAAAAQHVELTTSQATDNFSEWTRQVSASSLEKMQVFQGEFERLRAENPGKMEQLLAVFAAFTLFYFILNATVGKKSRTVAHDKRVHELQQQEVTQQTQLFESIKEQWKEAESEQSAAECVPEQTDELVEVPEDAATQKLDSDAEDSTNQAQSDNEPSDSVDAAGSDEINSTASDVKEAEIDVHSDGKTNESIQDETEDNNIEVANENTNESDQDEAEDNNIEVANDTIESSDSTVEPQEEIEVIPIRVTRKSTRRRSMMPKRLQQDDASVATESENDQEESKSEPNHSPLGENSKRTTTRSTRGRRMSSTPRSDEEEGENSQNDANIIKLPMQKTKTNRRMTTGGMESTPMGRRSTRRRTQVKVFSPSAY